MDTSREIVKHLINQDEVLRDAYYTTQMLFDAFDARNYKGFFDIIRSNSLKNSQLLLKHLLIINHILKIH